MSYQYQAFAKGQIRLLRFSATGLDGFTRIELETHALTDNLRYTALSYCWETTVKESTILVGYHERASLKITSTLAAALMQIRLSQYREQAFWIDQICINQDDNREQGHQIAMMDDIFYRAAQLVWLGKQDHDTELAFTTIEQACQELESQCRLETISQTNLEYVTMADSSRVLRIKDWFSVRDLLSRPWFSRFWVRTSRFFCALPDTY